MIHQKNKFYITTPIYYVNAKPHLGSLYSTLLADMLGRWRLLYGDEVFFMTGTDEHGQKISQAAAQAGKEPQAFVDEHIPAFKKVWDDFNIRYTSFGRTTSPEHTQTVLAWIEKARQKGDIYKGAYQGWYCISCETFVTKKDMHDHQPVPVCPSCSRTTTQLKEETYFFKLSAYQERLLKFYKENPHFITPRERAHEVVHFVQEGLHDLSISRATVHWGIPFPGDPQQVVYVWADALNIYISCIGYGQVGKEQEFQHWWPADVQVLGKDILRFHAVFWPAFLMSVGLPLPKKLLVHGWIKRDEQKMSKSRGNVVDPVTLYTTYGADPVRYYLMRQMSIGQDTNFSYEDVEQRITADLANDLGNLLNRTTSLATQYNLQTIACPLVWDTKAQALQEAARQTVVHMQQSMQEGMIHIALATLWKFIGLVNAYFHEQAPWKLAKTDVPQFAHVISAVCHSLRTIALLAWPCMPSSMEQLLQSLGVGSSFDTHYNYMQDLHEQVWNHTFVITKMPTLFHKPLPAQEQKPMDKTSTPKEEQHTSPEISIDHFAQTQLRVGTIVSCTPVEQSDKLYALSVDFGDAGRRLILSGVRAHFTPEQLVGKQGVFVYNLKPRKMLGQESQGMMLFVTDAQGKYHMVTVEGSVPNGAQLR